MSDLNVDPAILRGPVPARDEVSDAEFTQLVWAFRGIVKEQERERAFWAATNDNLSNAFLELEEKDRELEAAYRLIREDLALASRVQEMLLPRQPDAMTKELDVAVFHRQLAEVGGDYYDFFPLESGGYAIGVFDISGHGVAAALVMTYLKAQFASTIGTGMTAAETVERVNQGAHQFLRGARKYAAVNFVTFGRGNITYVNGGGNGLVVGREQSVEFVKRDQFLGVRNRPYHEFSVGFEPGDLLALYTDGIYEAQDAQQRDYTKKRLNRLIVENRRMPVQELVDVCREDYEQFRFQDSDDITLLLIRRKGTHDS
jgi:sigma-B regulation protein RsbU (phosphoserine phosphatase)